MSNAQEKMNIVLCMNSGYVMPSVVCMISILENNTRPVHFYILYSYLQEQEILHMKSVVEKYGKAHTFTAIKVEHSAFSDSPTLGRSREAYFRLLIPKYLPKEESRCLYLDGDTIVQKDLTEMYDSDFKGKAFMVCKDMGEFLFFHKERHEIFNIPLDYEYFNSGVLLCNLEYLRDTFSENLFIDYIEKNAHKLTFIDQDVLNALFYDKVGYVHSNLYNYMEILINPLVTNQGMQNAVIVHFLQKPWRYTYNGVHAGEWWKYGKSMYRKEYLNFLCKNFIYRKLLAIFTFFVSIDSLKKIAKKIRK